jgi:hypothetical protein
VWFYWTKTTKDVKPFLHGAYNAVKPILLKKGWKVTKRHQEETLEKNISGAQYTVADYYPGNKRQYGLTAVTFQI